MLRLAGFVQDVVNRFLLCVLGDYSLYADKFGVSVLDQGIYLHYPGFGLRRLLAFLQFLLFLFQRRQFLFGRLFLDKHVGGSLGVIHIGCAIHATHRFQDVPLGFFVHSRIITYQGFVCFLRCLCRFPYLPGGELVYRLLCQFG